MEGWKGGIEKNGWMGMDGSVEVEKRLLEETMGEGKADKC
jgi:hypothetical protein